MAGHDAASVQSRRQAALPYVIAGLLLTSLGGLLGFLSFAHLERWKPVVDFVQGMLFGVAMGLSIATGLILRKYLKD
jgi:hypothetical protein